MRHLSQRFLAGASAVLSSSTVPSSVAGAEVVERDVAIVGHREAIGDADAHVSRIGVAVRLTCSAAL